MKKLTFACIILTICLLAIFTGCKKSGAGGFRSPGVIALYGGCCISCECASFSGSLYYGIRFYSDTATLYPISNDISKFGINSGSKFPVKVIVNWQHDEAIKTGNNIIITQLKVTN